MTNALLTPDMFPQAARRAGLAARLSRRNLDNLGPLLLPCVLLLADQKACVLREIDNEAGTALIQLPENGGEQTMQLEALEAMYIGYCFFIKRQYRGDQSVDLHLHEWHYFINQ
ncbi:hypothetical protein [Salinivibrio sp. IB282]|uniref:hypothetical protein n=1 Tax=Salinivibrio sp. IB282 TaxID=1766122 RepID=UPI001F51D7F6|nr:hypothetical protein [Salinivibrio sp. IB282]